MLPVEFDTSYEYQLVLNQWAHSSYSENRIPPAQVLGGVCILANNIAHMKS